LDTTDEGRRLAERNDGTAPWQRWGPYLSDRQWGTVREDDSLDGNAWDSFPHDHARSRAYRWGEDGIAGLSDEHARLCFSVVLWNGRDPILKERLFGLTNGEGNHGEDVKELYWYLDATPTHSWQRMRYRYPQGAYPYEDLVATNRARGRDKPEYELWDTGVLDGRRFWDVDIDVAKADPDELCVRITAHNRGPDPAELHLLPTIWFRNTWYAGDASERPSLGVVVDPTEGTAAVRAVHPELGTRWLVVDGDGRWLVTENETNARRLWNRENATSYVKDGIDDCVVHGRTQAVNPDGIGTKAAAWRRVTVRPGGSAVLRLRLTAADPAGPGSTLFGPAFDDVMRRREAEADEFYASIAPASVSPERASIMRQALAGMLWSKQYFGLDVDRWLAEHPGGKNPASRRELRNAAWGHLLNDDIISMPDAWEYPWYAAWDLAFHTAALNMVDPEFAKHQLDLMLREGYLHPNGQLPAYEWNFGDVNPPVHAWGTLFNYGSETQLGHEPDVRFMEAAFLRLLLNFTWWANRKDLRGNNVYQGGFLGMDNIGVFDRSAPLPTGGSLEQADGTAWMALFSQNMLEMAIELAMDKPAYEPMVVKFVQHFLLIASAMDRIGDQEDELWDEVDGFFYDVIRLPDGSAQRLKVRSMVGILPLCAVSVIPAAAVERFPEAMARVRRFATHHPELEAAARTLAQPGVRGRRLLAVLDEHKLRRVLARVLDESEFLSPHGLRSLSRVHDEEPFEFAAGGATFRVAYEAAESTSAMFGGNSNWRGPIWFPVNTLVIRALLQYYLYYGDAFRVECPTGSGRMLTLFEIAKELADRLISAFERGPDGQRPVHGAVDVLQRDPDLRDAVLFYEYLNGDTGAGLGASHQTGWTGIVARLIQLFGDLKPEDVLAAEGRPITRRYGRTAPRVAPATGAAGPPSLEAASGAATPGRG